MQGQLFTQDFLRHGIEATPPWQALDEATLARFTQALAGVVAALSADSTLNEAQTEQLLIEPLLRELGWGDDHLRQVNLSAKRREDVPDLLLFPSAAAKAQALASSRDDQRYHHGLAILEAKRWLRPLDRGDAHEVRDPDAPSSQMLRYLSRTDVVSDRRIKWGILTNGAVWRLYWQDARSRAEEFLEIPLAAALGVPGTQPALDDPPPAHTLKLFFLLFHRDAFLPQTWAGAEGLSFHAYARQEARRFEERVSADLGQRIFTDIFPRLAQALAAADLHARRHRVGYGQFTRQRYDDDYLDEVREATLVLLYRLLFLFYAEDRLLLPAHDARYAPYSARGLRERVRDGMDGGRVWSSTMTKIWLDLRGAFELVDQGDDAVGIPAYNGGLFDRSRSPLLERTRVPDAVMAPIVDALSRRSDELLKAWINYRDLSVAHLGGVYEKLLEYRLVHEVQAEDDYRDKPEINRLVAQPASFARKTSGSYYTHDALVRIVLRESIGLLAGECQQRFEDQLAAWQRKASLTPPDWDRLDGHAQRAAARPLDPASAMLELAICDPAMGSGHFLVALVDDLADRVLEAASLAAARVNAQPWAAHLTERGRAWQSPVLARVAAIRRSIREQASRHGWAVTDAQLDDRHIVRRMVLKKCVFGVDKNPMAVELAKTALWLHTFTVGAPLSFLDHHLKHGDSLHGERLAEVQRGLQALGTFLQGQQVERLEASARQLAQVADFTDVDIAEARESKRLAGEAEARLAPIHQVLSAWRALRWVVPGWPVASAARLAKLGDEELRRGLVELLNPGRDVLATFGGEPITDAGTGNEPANALLGTLRRLAQEERFFHWWTAFPTVFTPSGEGGFDAVIGNPPWDRIKLQEVEWFAERHLGLAAQPRAADRKRLIAELRAKRDPLAAQYDTAIARAEANARVLAKAGDYPLLGGGDVNLYSLFVERAHALVQPGGVVALLTPSGIAADKGAAPFFGALAGSGRLGALLDYENRGNPGGSYFPDVDSRFKFCVFVFGGAERRFATTRCGFYLRSEADSADPARVLELGAEDFALVNPNTGAAPLFKSRRDADLVMRIYRHHPVLVRRSAQGEQRAWPVKYLRMFDMTNDSGLFKTAAELEAAGFKRAPLGRWRKGQVEVVPLYEGKMVQAFDHRAADVVLNKENLHRAALPLPLSDQDKANPSRFANPQYWVSATDTAANPLTWAIGFKEITAPTNARSMIAAALPGVGFGNKVPILVPAGMEPAGAARAAALLLANLNAFAFDYVLRQKLQGQTINLFILEQLPVIAPEQFDAPLPAAFTRAMRKAALMNGHQARPSVADFVLPQVLALSYTAHDLAPFARDLGYVDASGQVLPPMAWSDDERRQRRAALDAVFCWLYGLTADDMRHVLASFPIVREHDQAAYGRYRSEDDILALLPLLGVPASAPQASSDTGHTA